MNTADWKNFKKILCVRPDNMGDLIMTSPAIRALKKAVPGRKITLLTSKAGALIADYIPEVDEVITCNLPWEKIGADNKSDEVLALVNLLEEGDYDAAVLFNVYSQNPLPNAMLCYMAGIKRVAGYCRENPYGLITDWIPDEEPLFKIKHEVRRQLDLVAAIGVNVEEDAFSLEIDDDAEGMLWEKLTTEGVDINKPWIILHPGVSEEKRQYPPAEFVKAIKGITEKLNVQVLLTGSEAEKELAAYIQKESGEGVFSMAGKLSVEELLAAIKITPLLISNNTGPVHIAAAFKTPVLVLYALTNPQHTPWAVDHEILAFDVPVEKRSKNTIIKYAYQQSFHNPPVKVLPEEIVEGAERLLLKAAVNFREEVLNY